MSDTSPKSYTHPVPGPWNMAFAGLAALAVAMGIGRFAFTPLMPMMQAEGTITLVEGGWLASANYVGYLVGALSAVAIRLAPATMVRMGLGLVAVSTLAMAATHALLPGLLWRFLAGVASAWVLVSTSAWCLAHFEQAPAARRATLGAVLYAGVGVGIVVAGVACVLLAAAHVQVAIGWTVLGAAAAIATIALWPRTRGERQAGAAASTPALRWDAITWRLVVAYGIFGFGYIIPATFLSAMARDALPDPAIYGWSWPVFGAAAAMSVFLAVAMRRRLSERGLWIAGHLVMAAGVALPIAMPGLAGVVASGLLVGGTFMVVTMAGMQEARRSRGAAARPLMAAMTSAFALGQIAGPLLVSALAPRGNGYATALALSAAALVAACFLLFPFPEPTP